jgi:hypothetical protein
VIAGLARFAAIWAISYFLSPYLERLFDRMLQRAPKTGFLHDVLQELRDSQSTTLIRSFGETMGELVLGPKGGRKK